MAVTTPGQQPLYTTTVPLPRVTQENTAPAHNTELPLNKTPAKTSRVTTPDGPTQQGAREKSLKYPLPFHTGLQTNPPPQKDLQIIP